MSFVRSHIEVAIWRRKFEIDSVSLPNKHDFAAKTLPIVPTAAHWPHKAYETTITQAMSFTCRSQALTHHDRLQDQRHKQGHMRLP